jgi:D-alanyl-lipoteichoic acid acyltransferase DltB (MBOAT superfamily)
MDSASLQFVLFGLAVAIISNISRSYISRSVVLLSASLVFLGMLSHNAMMFAPLAGFLLLGYLGLAMLQRGWSKHAVWSILAGIFVYIWLKKYTFLPERIFLRFPYFTLGISYIFFRILHLLIEAGDGIEKRKVGFGAYLLYTLNFTTFVAGPIQRYDQFAEDQFAAEPIPLGPRVIGLQLERIVRGFFKVNVLAMLLHMIHERAFDELSQPLPQEHRLFFAFQLAVTYPLFIYANFSGYIDIIMGIARLMRVRLPENFNRPFSAPSFLEFWNRWHITLSNWLKAYVYNPLLLVLMRRIPSLSLQSYLGVISFFVTFFLIGIWHGRTSEFAVYGVLLGGGAAVNKLWQSSLTARLGRKGYKSLAANSFYIAFARGLTFSWFALSLFWFWADWKQIDIVYRSLGPAHWLATWMAVWICATVVLAAWEQLRAVLLSIQTAEGPVLTSRYARVVYASSLASTAIVLTLLMNEPAPAIVYKAF